MKKNIADFHVLVLFMAKKHDLSDKNVSVCQTPFLLPFVKICTTPTASPLQASSLLGQLDVPHTQNFEI
jgi:hypothetical protein